MVLSSCGHKIGDLILCFYGCGGCQGCPSLLCTLERHENCFHIPKYIISDLDKNLHQ